MSFSKNNNKYILPSQVTLTVSQSHAEGELRSFSEAIAPILSTVISRLPKERVSEIAPHMKALADIANGNPLSDFFLDVLETCDEALQAANPGQTSQSQLPDLFQREAPLQEDMKESQMEQVNVAEKEVEPIVREASSDQTSDQGSSNSDSEDSAAAPKGKKAPSNSLGLNDVISSLPIGWKKPFQGSNKKTVIKLSKSADTVYADVEANGQTIKKVQYPLDEVKGLTVRQVLNKAKNEKI